MSKKNEKNGDKSNRKDGIATLLDRAGVGFDGTLSKRSEEEGKEFYRAQIRDLEKQLDRYKDKCEELEKERKDYSSQRCSLEKEMKDIVQYLKRCLDQKENELSNLSECLVSLQQTKDRERDALELQLCQLRREFQENKDKLTSENIALAGKLAALEEFRAQKERLMADMDSLQQQLAKQKEEHDSIIYHLEKKAVLNNDRLKEEMQSHVAAVAAEIHRKSEQKMAATTRRAIQENVELMAQLGFLSDQSRQLLEENDTLKDQKNELHREKTIQEPLLTDITRKCLSNQKVVVLLTDRCKQMETELQEHSMARQELQQLQTEHTDLLAEIATLRQEHASMLEESRKKLAEAERLGAELRDERKRRGQLESTLQEAAFSITQALKEVPKEEDSEVDTISRRNQLMQKLLAVLNSAARLGTGPALTEFIPEKSQLRLLQTSGPKPERTGPRSPVLRSSAHLAHYKIGDLGLVPRQTQNYAATLSKMGPLSKNTRLYLYRKPSSQKKASTTKLDSLVPLITDAASGPLPSSHRPCPTNSPSTKPILK